MKKTVSYSFLAAILLIVLSGCATHPDNDNVEKEEPIEPSQSVSIDSTESITVDDTFYVVDYSSANMPMMFETNDSFLYRAQKYVLFTDKEYKDWMPLCGKPDCTHSSIDCNAWYDNGPSGLWLYGDHLYYTFINKDKEWLPVYEIDRMALDGSNHEHVLTVDKNCEMEEFMGSTGWTSIFHNKYLLLEFIYMSNDSETGEFERIHYCVDLEHIEDGVKEFELTLDGKEEIPLPYPYYGEGEQLYCTLNNGSNTVIKIDLSDFTATTLCTMPFEQELPKRCVRKDDKLYFITSNEETKIISVDMNTGETEIVNDDSTNQALWEFPYGDYIIGAPGFNFDPEAPEGITVYDLNGNIVQTVPYETSGANVSPNFALGYYIFGTEAAMSITDKARLEYLTNHAPNWYLDIRDIGTDNLMWRKWEP